MIDIRCGRSKKLPLFFVFLALCVLRETVAISDDQYGEKIIEQITDDTNSKNNIWQFLKVGDSANPDTQTEAQEYNVHDNNAFLVKDAVISAYENNYYYKLAISKHKTGKLGIIKAFNAVMPNFNYFWRHAESEYSFSYDSESFQTVNNKDDFNSWQFIYNLSLSNVTSLYTAAQGQRINNLVLQLSEEQIVFDVISTYIGVLYSENLYELAKSNTRVLNTILDFTRTRFELSESTTAELAQAQARLANSQTQEIRAHNAMIEAQNNFRNVVYAEPNNLIMPNKAPKIPENLEEFKKIAMVENIPMKIKRINKIVANSMINNSLGGVLPYLTFNYAPSDNDAIANSITVNNTITGSRIEPRVKNAHSSSFLITWPILGSGGAGYTRIIESKFNADEAMYDYLTNHKDLYSKVINAWNTLEMTISAVNSSEKAVEAAQTAVEGIRHEVELGTLDLINLLNAEQDLFQARVTNLGTKRDQILSSYSILRLMGALNINHMIKYS